MNTYGLALKTLGVQIALPLDIYIKSNNTMSTAQSFQGTNCSSGLIQMSHIDNVDIDP